MWNKTLFLIGKVSKVPNLCFEDLMDEMPAGLNG